MQESKAYVSCSIGFKSDYRYLLDKTLTFQHTKKQWLVAELEEHDTWVLVPKDFVPQNLKILSSMWVLWYPDGRLRKYKAKFCMRDDWQVEGVDYMDKYSPVASWSMVHMLMTLAIKENIATCQVDFSNAFVQSYLNQDKNIFMSTRQKGLNTMMIMVDCMF
jgi:Reverse transcriptase (RNA-dependent DNA polymerase)